MAGQRIWPLLAYGALGVLAFAGQSRARRDARNGQAREAPARRTSAAASRTTVDRDGALRAHEHGRGRQATSPWQIPWRGWKDILWRTYQKMNDNRLLYVAAGVVYFALLALFPAVSAFVSLYGLFADASTIDSHLSMLAGILPGGALDILHEELTRLTQNKGSGLSFGFVSSLLIALWSANAGMKAIIDALNVTYGEKETRSFIRLNLLSLALTLGAIVSMMLAIGAVVVVPIVLGRVGLGSMADTLIAMLRWPVLLALAILGLAVLYRYGPNRRQPKWQWLSVGSVTAAILWLVGSALFSWYISNFGNYDVTYGSLGAAVGMMVWMWMSTIVILLDAQLNAEIEHQTARDSTVGGVKPMGRRDASKADTIGAAQA
jgi:membrane protein